MIAQTIQLALAPVFVLVAIGSIIGSLTQRLGRVVDRSRQLQDQYEATEGQAHDKIVREIRSLDERIALIGHALRLMVMASISIGITVIILFVEEFANLGINVFAAGAFIIAICLLMWALLLFLKETRLATEVLRIDDMYLESDRDLEL
ncbi:DUF2721 domain-containing protein [Aurantiacibacter aquimixticola]|uniref:DUF2721 domain-containing protein n=2 Tax=Aurantiacibacter aquimixticola TaxID=1958945 RepID=A0A419RX64_9SPHN|nr:DUF2721 domain-containing protein [Aurantiacibacter aquimixticola]